MSSGPSQDQHPTATRGPSQSAAAPPRRIGRYRVRRVIASGGMGVVYEAVQESPRRKVAVKVLSCEIGSPTASRRFRAESQILARLQHPGIVQVYEAGSHVEQGERPFFAMEYVPNARPITRYAREKKLGTRERLRLIAAVCDAVHHGHQKGVIHRDLKPANILVDSRGQVKVIDFGVARIVDSDLFATRQTCAGDLVGTLPYMSPEQCDGDPDDIDTRSDVYALGVVLYELLAGKLPYEFKSSSVSEITRVVRGVPPARLSVVDGSTGEIEAIVFKALDKERQRRYQSVFGLGQDIRRYLAGEAVAARAPSLSYWLRIFARRHTTALAAASAVLLTLIAATVVSTTLYLRAEAALRAEAEQRALAEDRFFSLPQDVPAITPQEARQHLEDGEGYVWLDVRSVPEFVDGHVPGALNIPLAKRNPETARLEMNEWFLPVVMTTTSREAQVIVVCRSGRRSARAAQLLREAGYPDARNMAGGFHALKDDRGRVIVAGWSMLDYPVEHGDGEERSYASLAGN